MDSHLVTIEIGVESCTSQRMQLDCLTFYQYRFEGLDTKTMQCRCTVQHNRMFFDNIFQYIPNFCLKTFYHLLGRLNVVCNASGYEFFHDERLEQLDSHFLRQTALIQFKFRTNDDNGTT